MKELSAIIKGLIIGGYYVLLVSGVLAVVVIADFGLSEWREKRRIKRIVEGRK